MRVLLHDSHSPSGGAPGERDFVRGLNDRIVELAAARGIDVVRVPGDGASHSAFDQDYDAFLAPHYDADVYAHQGGAFWDRAAQSTTAARDDELGALLWRYFRRIPGAPPDHQERRNANTSDYYGFRLTTTATPGAILELGVGAPVCNGHGQPAAPDHDWLRANLDAIAGALVDGLADFGGVAAPWRFSVLGVEALTADQLHAAARAKSADVPREWAELYARLAPEAGIRTSIAFAQALKETDYFRFTGTALREWNNPAGLGVTGGAGPDGLPAGNRFPTREAGARAHLGHLLWYVGPHRPAFCDQDQRHFGAHKGLPDDVRQLSGRWAVPGVGYGENIADRAAELRAMVPPAPAPLWDASRADETPATLGDLRAYARALARQGHSTIGTGGHA